MPAPKQSLHQSEQGIVSIMVTMFIMVIITLLIMAFARISWREQRQSLDRQLSTQAFYAAESGVNAAITEIGNGFNIDKTNCDPTAPFNDDYIIDSTTGAEVSCLLIDTSPQLLEYKNVSMDASTVVRVDQTFNGSNTPTTTDSIEFSWQDTTGNTDVTGCPNSVPVNTAFKPFANWSSTCNAGVLRLDIIQVNGNFTRANFDNNVMTVYVFPTRNGQDNYPFNPSKTSNNGSGSVIEGVCTSPNKPKQCYVRIHGLSTSNFYVRMRSIYRDSQVAIQAFDNDGGGGEPLQMGGAQKLIDSTGRANDVLRRLEVRLPNSTSNSVAPSFGLQSAETLCKKFAYIPNQPPVPADLANTNCNLL